MGRKPKNNEEYPNIEQTVCQPSMTVNWGKRFVRLELEKIAKEMNLSRIHHDDVREWLDKIIKERLAK